MGIFRRLEDDVPSVFVAMFVAFLAGIVAFFAISFVEAYLFPRLPQFVRFYLTITVTVIAAGVTAAVTLGKLRKP
jgi:hypothetical protein